MRVLTILGARPQFIKAATVSRAILNHNQNSKGSAAVKETILHTGQHFDSNMSDIFFEQMNIPRPDHFLGVSGLSHGAMTGRMLEGIEKIVLEEKPDVLLVYGDTNSTLAGAIAAAKLHVPVAHVEAGLRSFNLAMPEEVNRTLTDRVSTFLFCPTNTAVENLENEGYPFQLPHENKQQILNVGDVMYDATLFYREKACSTYDLSTWGLDKKGYVLCTLHRAENTDDPSRLNSIFKAILEINKDVPVVLPLHPRTKQKLESLGNHYSLEEIKVLEPLSYLEMQFLEMNTQCILTDSGGVQKEAFFHEVPCITLRDETEWVETVNLGCNKIVGPSFEGIISAFNNDAECDFSAKPYGEGDTADKIISSLAI